MSSKPPIEKSTKYVLRTRILRRSRGGRRCAIIVTNDPSERRVYYFGDSYPDPVSSLGFAFLVASELVCISRSFCSAVGYVGIMSFLFKRIAWLGHRQHLLQFWQNRHSTPEDRNLTLLCEALWQQQNTFRGRRRDWSTYWHSKCLSLWHWHCAKRSFGCQGKWSFLLLSFFRLSGAREQLVSSPRWCNGIRSWHRLGCRYDNGITFQMNLHFVTQRLSSHAEHVSEKNISNNSRNNYTKSPVLHLYSSRHLSRSQ